MHLDLLLVLGSAVVGFLVGLTGMGGGALMTPMLVLLFGVAPSAAISSDLIAALFMKPLGVAIHWRRQSVNTNLVKLLCWGSVPAALAGTMTMALIGHGASNERLLREVLGVALIVGSAAMITRSLFVEAIHDGASDVVARPVLTIGIGVLGGFMVGLTSVGAGTLVLVLLALVYPSLRSDQLVGTDLAQSIPLTMSATVGSLIFGHVNFGLTGSIIVGSVPAVVAGALLSKRVNGFVLRRVLTSIVLLSGLKYIGAAPPVLAIGALLLTALFVLISVRRRLRQRASSQPRHHSVAQPVQDVVALLPTRLDRHP